MKDVISCDKLRGGALQFQKGFTPEGKAGRGRCLESDCGKGGAAEGGTDDWGEVVTR